jgi:acyl carrier protein
MKTNAYLSVIKKDLMIKKKITETTTISSVAEFDSVGILTFISLADKKYKKSITGDQFLKCKNIGDLISLLKKK